MPARKIKLAPVHPGEILLEEFMNPLALSRNGLARALHVPANHISDIVNEKRGISATMALRMARATSALRPNFGSACSRTSNSIERGKRLPRKIEREVLPGAS